jgi:hypothetical protein
MSGTVTNPLPSTPGLKGESGITNISAASMLANTSGCIPAAFTTSKAAIICPPEGRGRPEVMCPAPAQGTWAIRGIKGLGVVAAYRGLRQVAADRTDITAKTETIGIA